MTFTSPAFAPFLLAVLVLSAAAGRSRRWLVLLAASLLAYGTLGAAYLPLVLVGVAAATFACGLAMERTSDPRTRRWLLRGGVAVVLATLGVLKYGGFARGCVGALSSLAGAPLVLAAGPPLASVGVSYYSLQAISYLLDVHDQATPAERHLGRFVLYLAFFPKVVQGPIERPERLLPQLRDPPPVSGRDLAIGAQRILWGLFQKIVVADSIAPSVEAVYGHVRDHSGLPLVLATYLFAAQIYFDFAAYTDIALGTARLFGIRLSPNFRSPYLATSVAEFWRRWHVTFSSWLMDYVFRPLQLRLRDWRRWGTPAALLVTFAVSGLWHGAAWGFVVWGLLHGCFLATSLLLRPTQARLRRLVPRATAKLLGPVQVLLTFHLVCLAWIFFRADTVADGVQVAVRAVTGLPESVSRALRGEALDALVYLGQGRGRFLFVVGTIVVGSALRSYVRRLGLLEDEEPAERAGAGAQPAPWARAFVYGLMFYAIAFLGTATQGFLYEQF